LTSENVARCVAYANVAEYALLKLRDHAATLNSQVAIDRALDQIEQIRDTEIEAGRETV
jgi:hypothetical protein